MIEKIRHKLAFQYTVVITVMLFALAKFGYIMQRSNNDRFVADSLADYLNEEVWEAQELFSSENTTDEKDEVHKIASTADSFHNYTFWFKNGELVHAEEPLDEEVALQIKKKLRKKTYKDGQIYHENMKSKTSGKWQKWYFYLLQKTFVYADGSNGRVFVLFNYTGMRFNAKNYVVMIVSMAAILSFLAWLVGRYLVNKSMYYISRSYEKQREFVSNASHELRTPLAVLMGCTELLEYKQGNSEELKQIKKEIDNMSSLTNALLDIARFDAGNQVLKKENADAVALVKECAESASLIYKSANVAFTGEKSLSVIADKRLLRQLFAILLDNAFKYTHEPRKISVNAGLKNGHGFITVSDNGAGISASDIPLIFERFYRADKAHNGKISGSGLGLALAEAIIRLHGWKIEVESKLGKGSSFTVLF